MGTFIQDRTMYALFSKGFGKKGNDLLKNDFKDDKFDNKMTTKGKAGDGTSFETNFSDDNKADFKVVHPVDDGLTFTLKTSTDGKVTAVEATPEMKFDDNLTVKAVFKDPSATGGNIDIGANYITKDFSAELEGNLSKGEWKFGNAGFSLGLAADLPVGVDGLKLGLQPGVGLGEKPNYNANVNLAFEQKDYHVGINTFLTNGSDNKIGGSELVVWYKAADNLEIVGKFAQATHKKGKKAWEAAPALKEKEQSFSLLTCYNLSKTQTAKAKVTVGAATKYDFSLKTALEGKSSATFNVTMGADKPKFGFLYNLE